MIERSSNDNSRPLGPAIGGAAGRLMSLRRLAVQRAVLALAAVLATGFVVGVDPRLAVALGTGFVLESILAVNSVAARGALLWELAADPNAYALAEVRRFGASLTTPAKRLALARSIAAMLREAGSPNSVYLVDRVAGTAPALFAIAKAIADPWTVVEPTAIARLLHLLADGSRSPLLNPSVGAGELDTTLRFIEAGIRPHGTSQT